MEKLRVLQVIGAMNRGGAETVVMNLLRSIDRERFQFDFLVHEQGRCDYDDEIESLGCTIYRIPRFKVANAGPYRAVCRRFFAEHPEYHVVHGHIGSCASIYLDEAHRAGCATIAHSHNVNSTRLLHRTLYGYLVRDLPQIADAFLGCSLQAGIDRFGIGVAATERFNVMRNGIDLSSYENDAATHVRAKDALGYAGVPLVGNVGRLVTQKNQGFLLDVFAGILREVPEARLLVVGRGEKEGELKEKAESLGIAASVDFLGVRDDVPEILKALDVFVFPSLREGLGMSLVEAQAASVPCLATDTIARDAFLTDYAKPLPLAAGADEWARQAVALLQDPPARKDARQAIQAQGYDIESVARWMESYYRQLAATYCTHK